MNDNYVRIMHAVPDAPGVDIYANNRLIVENIAFGEYTPYLSIPDGEYNITIFPTGTNTTPVLNKILNAENDVMLTLVAAGTLDEIGLYAISDKEDSSKMNQAMVRFVHLSPDAPAVDITLPDGTVVFGNVSFMEMTHYMEVMPMDYTLQVRAAGTSDVVLTVPGLTLMPNQNYTVYAIGFLNGEPELEALLLEDGNVEM
ncbi:DUF4397 domain-containing protein [Anaeromicropila populeti]|uniref:DUF4397 domain-containing protein n=1 Tax=Anaeromicropila populeti TaxID=37658 RepID=A0A1I6JNT8_9FIRM|nr:DUF4397 domain-containing protein [Anaeromicropila populeti]SFR80619.1 protein of unknown function [Anaeromicropila populeti]